MKINRRHAFMSLVAAAIFAGPANAAETIRVGLPTKTYWPTTIAETAVRQKLFEKEGIKAELTIYRSGAETFEGMAAGAADIILDPPSLVSAGRKKGVMSRIVAIRWPGRSSVLVSRVIDHLSQRVSPVSCRTMRCS